MARAFAEDDLRDVLPTVRVPTLLLYGEVDKRSPMSGAEDLHRSIATPRLVVLAGAGHLSNIEMPAAFNRQVRARSREKSIPLRTALVVA